MAAVQAARAALRRGGDGRLRPTPARSKFRFRPRGSSDGVEARPRTARRAGCAGRRPRSPGRPRRRASRGRSSRGCSPRARSGPRGARGGPRPRCPRRPRLETDSGHPDSRRRRRRRTSRATTTCATSAIRASTRSRAARSRRCTAAGSGRCACSPASARPRTRTSASSTSSRRASTGLSTAFDMPALMGYDADHPMRRGEVGKEGVAVVTLRDIEVLFDGIPLDKVTTSMTINALGDRRARACTSRSAEKQGVPRAKLGGTHPERHAEGVHRAEGVDRPAAPGDADRHAT